MSPVSGLAFCEAIAYQAGAIAVTHGSDNPGQAVKPVRALSCFLGVVFIGGALLAPWLYLSAQSLAAIYPALQDLARQPFHRYVNRCFIILALLGLWPFLRQLGLRSWRDMGLKQSGALCSISWGFVLGFGSLAVIAALEILFGAVELNAARSTAQIQKHLLKAVSAAVFVGIAEELIFRGGLFRALARAKGYVAGLWISSLIYALVHFFSRPANPESVNWLSGFFILGGMLKGFTDVQILIPAFLNLTIAGLILARAFQRTESLWVSIGLHAGWIFWLKSFGFFTTRVGEASWFWGSSKLIDGWVALPVLAALYLSLDRLLPKRSTTARIE